MWAFLRMGRYESEYVKTNFMFQAPISRVLTKLNIMTQWEIVFPFGWLSFRKGIEDSLNVSNEQ